MITRIAHYPRRDGPLPEGARWVGRPSRWGNPHRIHPRLGVCLLCAKGATLNEVVILGVGQHTPAQAVRLYRREVLPGVDLEPLLDATALACICPIGQPCHADALTTAVNRLRAELEHPVLFEAGARHDHHADHRIGCE